MPDHQGRPKEDEKLDAEAFVVHLAHHQQGQSDLLHHRHHGELEEGSRDPMLGAKIRRETRAYSSSSGWIWPWPPPSMDTEEGRDPTANQHHPKTTAWSSYTTRRQGLPY
jgi:hypothetical protein